MLLLLYIIELRAIYVLLFGSLIHIILNIYTVIYNTYLCLGTRVAQPQPYYNYNMHGTRRTVYTLQQYPYISYSHTALCNLSTSTSYTVSPPPMLAPCSNRPIRH